MLNKILIAFFFSLLIVVVVEVIFLFMPKAKTQTGKSTTKVSFTSPTPFPNSLAGTFSIITKNISHVKTYDLEAEIVELGSEETANKGLAGVNSVYIQKKGDFYTSGTLLPKEMLSQLKIVEEKNGKVNPIELNQLKVGDKIRVKLTLKQGTEDQDLKLIEGEIRKL